jgi:methionine-R-sulfoxide reductase
VAPHRLRLTIRSPMIIKTDAEWRHQLSPEAFNITRRAGTEYPYTGKYWNLHDKGLYRCICCDTALFSSDTKYDSGTGWPSFWQPLTKENIHESGDYALEIMRTAISCRPCLRRWPTSNGTSLLHELSRAPVCSICVSAGIMCRQFTGRIREQLPNPFVIIQHYANLCFTGRKS